MSELTGKRILIVEDEPIVAMMVEDMLVELGAEVAGPASSVADALALIGGEPLDAALLDVNLNGERSGAVAQRLREHHVPYVFGTGYGWLGEEQPGGPVLQKPYRLDELEAALVRLVDGTTGRAATSSPHPPR